MAINKIETNPEYALSVFIILDGHKYNDGYDTEAHIKWLRDNVTIGESNCVIDFFLKVSEVHASYPSVFQAENDDDPGTEREKGYKESKNRSIRRFYNADTVYS